MNQDFFFKQVTQISMIVCLESCNLKRRCKSFLLYFLSWKYLFCLTILALCLQIISVCLSWWVQAVSSKRDSEIKHQTVWEVPNRYMVPLSVAEILELITHASILDTSGEYKLAIGVLARNSFNSSNYARTTEEKNEITLVSQCSLSRLHFLPELAKRWEGPLSVSLFLLPEEIETAVRILLLLRKCVPDLQKKTTFSVVYPLSSSHRPIIKQSLDDGSCTEIPKLFSKFNRSNYNFGSILYPNNLLRNAARKAVKTDYMFVVDVDMIPSQHLHLKFLAYLQSNKLSTKYQGNFKNEQDKTVWVVPSYEIDIGVDFPGNKSDLLKLREIGKARPFYQELCWKCQKYTEYGAWEKRKPRMNEKETDPLQHLYEVLWRDPWEPFYISKTNVPFYDERFRQYGFNRISQVCELHVAGYRFLVLDSAFVIHRGFKSRGGLHERKDEELERNRILFRQFKVNLKEKYPDSSRRCY